MTIERIGIVGSGIMGSGIAEVAAKAGHTVVLPSGNGPPLPGVQVTPTAPLTASLAVTVKVTTAPAPLVASAVTEAGPVGRVLA